MGLFDFTKYLFNKIPVDYQGAETGYYVVPNDSQFTFNSYEFRLVPLADGCFAACWKDFIQVRDGGGCPLWRADKTGHFGVASPDGRQLIAIGDATGLLTCFDARTGQVLASARLPELPAPTADGDPDPGWPRQLALLPNGLVAVLLREGVGLLTPGGTSWQAYYHGFMPPEAFSLRLKGMVWQAARPAELLVWGGGQAVVLDLGSGRVLRQAAQAGAALLPGPRGQQPLLYDYDRLGFLLLDPATLAVARSYPFAGVQGVRTEAESQHRQSGTFWEKRAVLSPTGQYLLAIDSSGLVWLFDAQSGSQLRIFRRELINHAYDLLWLDDQQFLALTNRGHVVKINITQLDSIFDIPDFTPEDDARHLPVGDDTHRNTASTGEQVLSALDTLATAPDAAAYAAAWETIHFALPDFDWPRHLTPAHLDGAMRQLAWMLPQSGFAGLEAFGPLRQALLAVQDHCPTAPVAPVLALHDSVFGPDVTFKTLETGATLSIEFQLHFAYWQLCALLREEPDFAEAAALVNYKERLEAADALLTHFHEGFGWEAPNLLERACPHLAGHYAQRLATFPAPVQCLLIYPLRRPTHPAAQALLRELAATAPHPDVRIYARQALGEAGA